MRMTIAPLVIGTFCTVTDGLLKGLEDLEVGGRVETIQITALLKMARIPRRVLETLRRLSVSQTPVKKPSAKTDMKNSKGVNNK